jgi:hypothetical protein
LLATCVEDQSRRNEPVSFVSIMAKGKVKNVMCSRFRSGVAQRVGSGIALLFHDRGTRRG